MWQPSLCLWPRGTPSVPQPSSTTQMAPHVPCAHPGSHALPYAACLCCLSQLQPSLLGKELDVANLCFHSTWWLDTDVRKAKGHPVMRPTAESFFHRRKATVLQAGGRKTRESKEVSQMHWVIPFQVWAGQLRYAWTRLDLSVQSAFWEPTKPKLFFQIFIKK